MNGFRQIIQKYKLPAALLCMPVYYLILRFAGYAGNVYLSHFSSVPGLTWIRADAYTFAFVKEAGVFVLVLLLMWLMGQLPVFGRNDRNGVPRKGFFRSLVPGAYLLAYALFTLAWNLYTASQDSVGFQSILTIVSAVLYFLAVGAAEESMFRGIIADLLIRHFTGTGKTKSGSGAKVWAAVALSGLLFALVHLENLRSASVNGVLIQTVGAFVLGMLITAVYFRTKNIWAVIFLHAFNDIAAGLPAAILDLDMNLSDVIDSADWRTLLLLIPYLIALAIVLRRSKIPEIMALWRPAEEYYPESGEEAEGDTEAAIQDAKTGIANPEVRTGAADPEDVESFDPLEPEEAEEQENNGPRFAGFESLETLWSRWKDGTFIEIVQDWKWIFSYSARYKGAIAFYVVLGIVSTSLTLVNSVVGKYLIDIITGYQTERLGLLVGLMIGTALFSLVFNNVINRISTRLSIYINNDIQADIFDQIIDADWLSLNQYSNGDILNRFNTDVSTVASNAISWLPTIIIAMFNFIATFGLLWHYDHVIALIAIGSAPFLLMISRFVIWKQREYAKKVREMNSEMMTFEVETFYNFDTIKSFGITDQYGRTMRDWQKKYKKLSLKYNLFTIQTNVVMSVMGTAVEMIVFLYCLFLMWNGSISYGTMTLFLQQRARLAAAFSKVLGIVPNFLNSSVSAHRIRELVDLPRDVHIEESRELKGKTDDGVTVSVKDVHFEYTEGHKVIKDSEFIARPGEIVALVGPSGQGKTTMIRLILGLIRPQKGAVEITASDGTAVESNANTRHLFAYVPQGNTILSGTIAENMRMVKEDASDEEIIEALKIACAWNFVKLMPEQIEEKLGERGKGLSEGQAQRIAIARAVLRDAPVLLLDEATSALVVTTERQVLKNIITQRPNKTCIVTTHRPSVLTMCQRVYRVMGREVTELNEEEAGRMAINY
ncbi:MAG: ATP-binding cassette domain-containing protein [Firmicutes bacterium]|nr:ATP-binding cassette domain-containing protein [Bacillota bacterium]